MLLYKLTTSFNNFIKRILSFFAVVQPKINEFNLIPCLAMQGFMMIMLESAINLLEKENKSSAILITHFPIIFI